ncbi:MAG: ABC transporter permease [Rhodospirillales bacterium 20-64-7]|nr:MAG: ABC transporter permease [Rhodospirillales bacterium 20-64-7]HQT75986.1 ABC transporter permease subunit [Rhodopila sp.]
MADAATLPRSPRVSAPGINRAASLLGLALLWWVVANVAASPQLLPGPVAVLGFAWQEIRNGTLPWNVAITLARVVAAFSVAMIGGGVAGYLAGRSRRMDALIDPWAVVALNLPVLVVVVLAYIWIGLNDTAAVLAVAIAKAPTVFVTIREGTRALDRGLAEVGAVYRLPYTRRLRRIELPQLMPFVAAASRSGLSITWKIVLLVELLGRPNGVGFVLNMYFQNFDVTGILAYGLTFAAIMLVVEVALLQPWERHTSAWRRHA